MRRTLIAGNWKMNLDRNGAVRLARSILADGPLPDVDLVVCPPMVYLDAVGNTLRGSPVAWGAQDVFYEKNGAFTGAISTEMLLDLGCQYVILGHSERRHKMGETDEMVAKKVSRALAAGLVPIVCFGETIEQRQGGQTLSVVQSQLSESLGYLGAEEMVRVVIAYEPVWAIGTGVVATTQQAQEVHADLRKLLGQRYNVATAQQVRILYGGSVTAENAAPLLNQADIDGALVGGASLKADSFLAIARSHGNRR